MRIKMKKQIYLIFVMILIFSISVFSLTIEYPNTDYIKQNIDIVFNFKVYDDNYILLDNTTTSCNLNIYKSNGTILYETTTQGSFYVIVSKTNFSELGKLYYSINCNTSTDGGFVNKEIEVTSDGKKEKKSEYLFLLIILSLFIFIWILKYFSETLNKKHEILKGLLILNMILLSIFGLFISIFMSTGEFNIQIEILKKNILTILTIFTICISSYFLITWIISFQNKKQNKYSNKKEN